MSAENDQEIQEEQPVPIGQVILDEWFLWLVLGFVLSVVLYNAWGLWELMSLPTW